MLSPINNNIIVWFRSRTMTSCHHHTNNTNPNDQSDHTNQQP